MKTTFGKHNIQNCEDEPIHIPESIQSYGYLLAARPDDGKIKAYSENSIEIFGSDLERRNLNDILGGEKAAQITSEAKAEKRLNFSARINNEDLNLVAYRSSGLVVIEIEKEPLAYSQQSDGKVSEYAHGMAYEDSFSNMTQNMAEYIKQFTGFDRVMIYKFDENKNGQVISEAKEKDLEPFLGLNYPASDIPPQARRLYLKNTVRIIPDVSASTVPVLPALGERDFGPIDMTDSLVRAVSPIHIQYLKNMGVQASMSLSLVIGGELWGLVACHHYTPHHVSLGKRLECETLARLFSYQLQNKEQEDYLKKVQKRYLQVDQIFENFSFSNQRLDEEDPTELLSVMGASGFALKLGKELSLVGDTPSKEDVLSICKRAGENRGIIYSSQKASEELQSSGLTPKCAGFLVTTLARKNGSFAIWFRQEREREIKWAGRPADKSELEGADRLSPRGSFALWSEIVEGETLPWTSLDQETAMRFNKLFVKLVIDKMASIQKSLNRLKQADSAKDRFLAHISHELRTPLTAILGWTEYLQLLELDSEEINEAIDGIVTSAENQRILINDLLDMSRLAAGKLVLDAEPLSLVEVINEALELQHNFIKEKGHKIDLEVEDGDIKIMSDRTRLLQIILNIISNAVKYTPENGEIKITANKSDKFVHFICKDNGIGFDAGQGSSLFKNFYQASQSHQRKGMGLGLGIVKALVDLMGGEVSALSAGAGLGATFEVHLPFSPAQTPPKEEESQVKIELVSAKDKKVLLVEDEFQSRKFLEKTLTHLGLEVTSAGNGKEALDALEKGDFDVILSDIGMDIMDGIEFIKRTRAHADQEISEIPAIALTAYAYPKDRVRALKAGFNNFITKPISIEELLFILEETLDR